MVEPVLSVEFRQIACNSALSHMAATGHRAYSER